MALDGYADARLSVEEGGETVDFQILGPFLQVPHELGALARVNAWAEINLRAGIGRCEERGILEFVVCLRDLHLELQIIAVVHGGHGAATAHESSQAAEPGIAHFAPPEP